MNKSVKEFLVSVVILIAVLVFIGLGMYPVFANADYEPPKPQVIRRQFNVAQVRVMAKKAPPEATMNVPIAIIAQMEEEREAMAVKASNTMARLAMRVMPEILADSRSNIPELEGMTDEEIVALYLAQIDKPVTNTAESVSHLIGQGMREDIEKGGVE